MSAGAYRCDLLPRQLPTRLRYGNSARVLGQIRNYALQRLAIWLSKQGNRRRAWRWGLKQVLLSPNRMGLISLDGTVVAPRPSGTGAASKGPNAVGEERR
jgi:hypothetical protein